jgi:hypothetical protein
MSDELVIEVGSSKERQLQAKLVSKRALKRALGVKRPKVLLVYQPGSRRGPQVRMRVLREAFFRIKRARDTITLSDDWQLQVVEMVRELSADRVLFFVDSSPAKKKSRSVKVTKTPLTKSLEQARARQDRVLRMGRWYDASQVAKLLNGHVARSNPSQFASKLRSERRLLGVRHRGEYLHPEFQFDTASGTLRPEMARLLKVLPDEASGWVAALWCFQPTGHLRGKRPKDVFGSNAEVVIDAATRDFVSDESSW